MTTFLFILKIIGLVMLGIAACIVLLLLIVLFVPIRYKIAVMYENDPVLDARLCWLFPLFFAKYHYHECMVSQIKIMGVPINRLRKKHRVSKRKTKKPNHKVEIQQEENSRTENKGFLYFIKNTWYTIKLIYDKLKKGIVTIHFYVDLLKADCFNNSRKIVFDQLLYLIYKVKPNRVRGKIRFGFDDPSLTGYGMAIYGIIHGIWKDRILVLPDFEQSILEIDMSAKGTIQIFCILKVIFKLYFSKDVQELILAFKKE